MIEYTDSKLTQQRVVTGEELFTFTSSGWTLIATIQEDVLDFVDEPDPDYNPQPSFSGYPCAPDIHDPRFPRYTIRAGYKRRHLVTRISKHIVGRDETSALGEMSKRLEELCVEIQDVRKEKMDLEHTLSKVRQERDDAQAEKSSLKDQLDAEQNYKINLQDRIKVQVDRNRKLEADLGKIRDAIGAIEFKKIIGTTP